MKATHLALLAAAAAFAGSAIAADTSSTSSSKTTGGVPGVDVDVNADANVKAPIVDKNSDGKITKAEAASNKDLSKQFSKLDTNHDGTLDMTEYAKFEGSAQSKTSGGVMGNESGDEAKTTTNRPGTTDDSTAGNKDKLGPGR